jgi:putative transposase
MPNLNTELMKALLKNESLDEFFRSHLEKAVNDLLKNELTAFLGYEKHSTEGYGTGNSRNGSYSRGLDRNTANLK